MDSQPSDGLPFRTDDSILRDLRMLEAALLDIHATAGSMARRAQRLIQDLAPRVPEDQVDAA